MEIKGYIPELIHSIYQTIWVIAYLRNDLYTRREVGNTGTPY